MDPIFKINEIIIDRLKRHMPRDVKITDIKFAEKEATVKFKYDSDNYEYKISSAGIKRQTDKTFLDYSDLQCFEDFFEDLRARLFSGNEPGQVSLFDYDKQHDEESEPKRLEVVNSPEGLDDEKVIHELSNEEGQELNKLVDDIQTNDEKEFGEELADEMSDNVIDAEFEEKKQLDSSVNSENLNVSISNSDETSKDDTNIIEDENIAINALIEKKADISNLKIEMPIDTPKHCERCGQVAIELDVNNECAECAKEDIFEPGTVPNGFGQSITASF